MRPVASAADASGSVLTHPVRATGGALVMNADATHGAVTVSVLGAAGEVVATSEPLTGQLVDAPVRWRPAPLALDEGSTIRLRFDLHNATLYSFGFAESHAQEAAAGDQGLRRQGLA
jgi:hypothetical protein